MIFLRLALARRALNCAGCDRPGSTSRAGIADPGLQGKSKHALWIELCDMCTKHAKEITGLKVEPIVRGALRRFSDDVGRLWTALADYFIRLGHFEKVRAP